MNASAIAEYLRRPVNSSLSGQADESSFALRQGQRQVQTAAQPIGPEAIPQIFDINAVQLDIDGMGDLSSGTEQQQGPLIDISI